MFYTINIKSKDNEEIIFGKNDSEKDVITDVNVILDTIDDNVRQKSNIMQAKVTIKGKIAKEIMPELIKIFNWSKDADKEKWYRSLEIKIFESEGSVIRKYNFEQMFVVDYFEFYNVEGNNKDDRFELKLTQLENNFKTIVTY